MKHLVKLSFLLVFFIAGFHNNAFAQKRVALVIGNNSYENLSQKEQLLSAVNDAKAVKNALESLGFEVMYGENLGRDEFENKIFDFSGQIGTGDIALFFYAGHGVNLSGGNYFLPSDIRPPQSTRKSEESRLIKKSIWEQEIIAQMKEAGASVSIAVIDACRNNPLTNSAGRSLGGKRGLRRSISEAQDSKGTFSIYSAGYGQQALDRLPGESTGVNSVFTRVFVKQLIKPRMTLRKLAVEIKQNVSRLVGDIGHEQDPAYYDGIQGKDPYLSNNSSTKEVVKKNEENSSRPVINKEQPKEYELALWDSVRNSDDQDVISVYLKKYPNGFFADLAKVKLLKLRSIRIEGNSVNQLADWRKVENSNNIDRLQAYIDDNPDSSHIDEARNRIAVLERANRDRQRNDRDRQRVARERDLWIDALSINTLDSFQRYLRAYPDGRYVASAMSRIANLTAEVTPPRKSTPSFNCNDASKSAEYTICNYVELGDLDNELAQTYRQVKSRLGRRQSATLSISQRVWLKQRNNCKNDQYCIERAYQQRIGELQRW